MTTDQIIVTNSDIEKFLKCRRAWWWGFVENRNLPDKLTGAAPLGNRVHSAIEVWYRDGSDPLAEHDRLVHDAHNQLLADDAAVWTLDKLYEDAIVGRNCVASFMDWLADTGADHGRTVDGVELVVEAPILDGSVLLRGKIDVRFRMDVSGMLVSDDLKTTGWDLGRTRDRLERSYQPYVYDYIQSIAHPTEVLAAAEYTVIKKVARNRKGVPTIERFSVPGFLRSKPHVYRQIDAIVTEMLRVRTAGLERPTDKLALAYPTPGDECAWCDFKQPCLITNESPVAGQEMLDTMFTAGRHDRYNMGRVPETRVEL